MTKAEIIAHLLDMCRNDGSMFVQDVDTLEAAAELLEKSEEVRHGQWICNYGAPDIIKCSACCYEQSALSRGVYCKICGARMDGGEDNDSREM